MALSSVACFAGFTPVHEAAHGNASHKRIVNEAIGHMGALLLLGSFCPYRFLHLEHHRQVDDPVRDPDRWSMRGPVWAMPMRWATQDVVYLIHYARRWTLRPWPERADLLSSAALLLVVGLAAQQADALFAVVLGWWVPARIALVALAATFTWLPHRPLATGRTRWPTRSSLLTFVLLGQDHHLAHHLRPAVPFHRLAATARALADGASAPAAS
jgi:fatty acid desaturase